MRNISIKASPALQSYLVAIFFLIVNLITVSWINLPWLDEVMFSDTSINFSQGWGWTTKAWYSSVGSSPVSTYPPLYQMVLAGWIRIFGISVLAVRSLTISLSFLLLVFTIHFLYKNGFVKKSIHLLLFTLIYCTADTFSWISRSSRVDFFNLFCVVIFFYSIHSYIQKDRPYYYIIIFGIIAVLSGIQTIPYIIFILIWLAIFLKSERKKILRCILFFGISLFISLLLLFIFFKSIDALIPFLVSVFSYSVTLKKIGMPLLPYIGPWFGIDPDKFISTAIDFNDLSFFDRILKGYLLNKESLILILASSICMISYKKMASKIYGGYLLVSVGIITPILMNLSGRYEYYYTWMDFFPLLLGITLLLAGIDKKITNYLFILLSIIFICTGLPNKILNTPKDRYPQLENFVNKFPEDLKNDTIATSFNTYYLCRKLSKDVYAMGIFPTEMIPDNVNILLDDPNDYKSHAAFLHLIEQKKSKGIVFQIFDSLQYPKLYYYRKRRD